ncbi:MAG TPA: MBOAT family O-acyltransferase, partial [Flavobacteriales bacterium]|nr:MBOAT family O-acyltransferase [Flavobacteriales bacterium]
MLFNSFAFLVFLPLVFIGYWWVFRSLRAQNLFVIAVSYVFYGWWDWRFTILLLISSVSDYGFGLFIDRQDEAGKRKRALLLSLVFNLGILAFFKYFNFFIDSAEDLLRTFGLRPNPWSLRVILPVGISFYTFQSMSYTIEVYRRNFKPVREPVAYLAFVSFFPHMVAGPIMRAVDLLPQFMRPRVFDFDKARDGARQMLWGFFKKIVIADQCAPLVDRIFGLDPATTPGVTLFFGAVFFAFQIYGDFSGYSDIAIGCARFFGIDLMRNFNYPYFSRSIGEFWRRWHISLSTWFRDFVYVPLGGNRTPGRRARNILITFAVSGLWHGANWTYVGWGLLHGSYHVPGALSGIQKPQGDPRLRDLPRMGWTFLLVLLGWVLFRAATLHAAWLHLRYTASNALFSPGNLIAHVWRPEMLLIVVMLLVEWRSR